MSVKPITPDEALEKFSKELPDFVVEAVNEMLAEKFSGNSAEVQLLQKDIVSRIMEKGNIPDEEEQSVFDKKYLDFEPLYRRAGWTVTYDKPGYGESYEAYFIFKKKRS